MSNKTYKLQTYIDKNYDNDVDNQNETFCISALALLIRRNTKPFIAVNSMIFQKLTIPTVGVSDTFLYSLTQWIQLIH